MGLFGLRVLSVAAWHVWQGTMPAAGTMSLVGAAALIANGASLALLWAYRSGDANMRSAWICTRNDVLGNFYSLRRAYLEPAPVGQMWRSLPSWRHWLCKDRG